MRRWIAATRQILLSISCIPVKACTHRVTIDTLELKNSVARTGFFELQILALRAKHQHGKP